ncbi:MAG: hypothetical protein J3R72DRAFT_454432 [Linnemannia gamsii]|nr:MAG: hypothetical protein J3R72DRAFT_454432 [Linnemannia gamsii]
MWAMNISGSNRNHRDQAKMKNKNKTRVIRDISHSLAEHGRAESKEWLMALVEVEKGFLVVVVAVVAFAVVLAAASLLLVSPISLMSHSIQPCFIATIVILSLLL